MVLRVRLVVEHLPIDGKTYEEMGRAIHSLARLGADKIEYADAEGIVIVFSNPDRLFLPVDEETIRNELKDLKRLIVDIENDT